MGDSRLQKNTTATATNAEDAGHAQDQDSDEQALRSRAMRSRLDKAKAKQQEPSVDADGADQLFRVMQDTLDGYGDQAIDAAPDSWKPAMQELQALVYGKIPATEAVARFDGLKARLAPVLKYLSSSTVGAGVAPGMEALRQELVGREQRALTRDAEKSIKGALVVDDGDGKKEAIDLGGGADPHDEGRILGMKIPDLVAGIEANVERAKELGDKLGASEEMVGKLEMLGHSLTLVSSFLKLSEDDFKRELLHVQSVMGGIDSYSELVEKAIEMGSAAAQLTCELSGVLMKAVGETEMAESCAKAAGRIGGSKVLGTLLAGIEIVHGLSVVLNSNKSDDDRISGGVEVASGIATIAAGGESLAAAPIVGPYLMLKGVEALYSGAVIGMDMGFLKDAFGYMQEEAGGFNKLVQQITTAQLLQQSEKDPKKHGALGEVEQEIVGKLAGRLDSFLADCEPTGKDHGIGSDRQIDRIPGNYKILADAFALPRAMRGATTLEEVSTLAQLTMKQIAWCFQHGQAIVQTMAQDPKGEGGLATVDKVEEKWAEQKREKERDKAEDEGKEPPASNAQKEAPEAAEQPGSEARLRELGEKLAKSPGAASQVLAEIDAELAELRSTRDSRNTVHEPQAKVEQQIAAFEDLRHRALIESTKNQPGEDVGAIAARHQPGAKESGGPLSQVRDQIAMKDAQIAQNQHEGDEARAALAKALGQGSFKHGRDATARASRASQMFGKATAMDGVERAAYAALDERRAALLNAVGSADQQLSIAQALLAEVSARVDGSGNVSGELYSAAQYVYPALEEPAKVGHEAFWNDVAEDRDDSDVLADDEGLDGEEAADDRRDSNTPLEAVALDERPKRSGR